MNLNYLANLGEIVGADAVVISLIYLAIQVRQNSQSQRTENYVRALDRLSAMQSILSQDGELSRLYAKGVQDTATLTAQEKMQFTWSLYEAFGAFEFLFHAAQIKMVPEEVWARWSATVAWWLSFPGMQAWWAVRPVSFTTSFTPFVDATLRDNPTDKDAARRGLHSRRSAALDIVKRGDETDISPASRINCTGCDESGPVIGSLDGEAADRAALAKAL
jgi:hypothetical protein